MLANRLQKTGSAIRKVEQLLQERGPEFGIAEGSQLEQVVQAKDLDRSLQRKIDIDYGLQQGRGLSLGT